MSFDKNTFIKNILKEIEEEMEEMDTTGEE